MQTNPLRSFEDPRVDAIYKAVKGRITVSSIVPSCIEIASEIEQLVGLKGAEKLSILQDVLRLAISESKLTKLEKEEILHTVETVVPIVVQAAILASKSPILKHVQATCVGCWTKA
jgi:hypothetical protein